MISVEEAYAMVMANLAKPTVGSVPIQGAVGKVLAEDVVADRDFPPFDRVTMDGIAICRETFFNGVRTFTIDGAQAAGEVRKRLSESGAIEVMTGAVLPEGADVVVRYEDIEIVGGRATINKEELEAWENVHRQGSDAEKGQVLLMRGTMISAAEVAILASVGKGSVTVFEFPATAVISSGDELVDIQERPLPHQVRRSNSFAILASMSELGWEGKAFHFRDEKEHLKRSVEEVLRSYDVLIFSGGVSRGKFDFIPDVLEEVGISKHFHQVSQRPGKPFWFGASGNKVVFALPGNPVSTFMCFHRYIRPWFLRSVGTTVGNCTATLASDFSFAPALTYFLQVRVQNINGALEASPVVGGGSGDFINLRDVDGFLQLPADRSEFRRGEVFPYYPFRPGSADQRAR